MQCKLLNSVLRTRELPLLRKYCCRVQRADCYGDASPCYILNLRAARWVVHRSGGMDQTFRVQRQLQVLYAMFYEFNNFDWGLRAAISHSEGGEYLLRVGMAIKYTIDHEGHRLASRHTTSVLKFNHTSWRRSTTQYHVGYAKGISTRQTLGLCILHFTPFPDLVSSSVHLRCHLSFPHS